MTDPAASVRQRRAESNAAIAARSADRVVALMSPDISVSVAGGPILIGLEASRKAFAEQFAERDFLGYVRTPDAIAMHHPATRATERGRWVGRWRAGAHVREMQGVYRAVWQLTDVGWFLESEVFE
ncbi:MAG: nuclear transport factor 2 family protein [Gemmatimonadaceae bacterium]|nr:nuclear transport factor 2 family protein [Gemmatimonadaceae bacterium]